VHFLIAVALLIADPLSVDEKVMPREGAVLRMGTQIVEDDRSNSLPYEIRQVTDASYLVGDADAYWVKQADVVPLASATAYYSEQIKAKPSEWLYRMRGIARLAGNDVHGALSDLSEAIRIKPNEAAHHYRGEAYHQERNFDRAIADQSEAIARSPQFAFAYESRGRAWREKGDLTRALADFEEAIRLEPKFFSAIANRAAVRGMQGDIDRALADYNELLRLDPKRPKSYAGRAYAWQMKGRLDLSIADYEEALRLGLNDPFVSSRLAFALATARDEKLRDGPRAVELATKAYEVTKGYPGSIEALAAGHAELGEFEEASKWQQKAIAAWIGPDAKKRAADRLALYQKHLPCREDGQMPASAVTPPRRRLNVAILCSAIAGLGTAALLWYSRRAWRSPTPIT